MSVAKFETAVNKAIENRQILGAAVIATNRHRKKLYAGNYGHRVVTPATEPMQSDSMAWMASCTKLFTSVAVLQCVERKLLHLDEPVENILPELGHADILVGFDDTGTPILKKAQRKITLRHLLTHSSGLGYNGVGPLLEQFTKWQNRPKSKSITEIMCIPLLFEPGESFVYGYGLDWAGKMVERTNGGMRLGEFMRQNIWEPLGMHKTAFEPSIHPQFDSKLIQRAVRLEDGTFLANDAIEFPDDKAEDDFGGSGTYSCAGDYTLLLAALLANDGKLLRQETVDEMFQPQLEDPTPMFPWLNQRFVSPLKELDTTWNYTLCGACATQGVPGAAGKGTTWWSGMANSYWFIDRERGVCGVYVAQIVPPNDVITDALFVEFQKAAYELAVDQSPST